MLIPRRRNSSELALLSLLCVLASCATPDAGRRTEGATSAEALLAEARHAKDPATQIGLALAAADSAARTLSVGDARLTYNAACVELAARVGKSTGGVSLPATFSPPSLVYRLEFTVDRPVALHGALPSGQLAETQ